jgi:hypothetical protein
VGLELQPSDEGRRQPLVVEFSFPVAERFKCFSKISFSRQERCKQTFHGAPPYLCSLDRIERTEYQLGHLAGAHLDERLRAQVVSRATGREAI